MAKKKNIEKFKVDNEFILARIKYLLDEFYKRIGRQEMDDYEKETGDLLYQISEIITKARINPKVLILSSLKREYEN